MPTVSAMFMFMKTPTWLRRWQSSSIPKPSTSPPATPWKPLLVNEKVAPELLPALKTALEAKSVHIKGDAATQAIIAVEPATEDDWKTEYLDYILAIRIVPDLRTAIDHINTYGSGHTDVILTTTEGTAKTFMTLVDSAGVFLELLHPLQRWFPFWLWRRSRDQHQ